jgi:glycosyltransferase involved in cell wall biosynthesis
LSAQLLINLSFLIPQPTGLAVYAKSLLPYLKQLDPILLSSRPSAEYRYHLAPSRLTADKGTIGHFQRLLWTQFLLPKLYHDLSATLLFSPITEAPLYTNCRYIVTCHDLIPLRFPRRFSPLTPYFQYYVPRVLRQAEHIICNSESTAEDIIHFYKIPVQNVTPILLAYDAIHFKFLDLPKLNYFLYIGRTIAYKNLERIVAAFATLPNCRDYELWFAGPIDDRFRPILQRQIIELNLAKQVKFLDYIAYEDLPTLINQAIALVFPSLWEGFGLPVLEALACGTPVITSNLSSLPEVAGDAALMVDPYNVDAIGQAMRLVTTDLTLAANLRQAGLARAAEFSWAKTGQATSEILQRYL